MTTLTITCDLPAASRLDRMILRLSAALERSVSTRLEKRAVRSGAATRAAAQQAAAEARSTAQALGAFGILPR